MSKAGEDGSSSVHFKGKYVTTDCNKTAMTKAPEKKGGVELGQHRGGQQRRERKSWS